MDWQLLLSIVRAKVALKGDLNRFDDAVHIYQHWEDVHAHGHQCLRDLKNLIFRFEYLIEGMVLKVG